MLQPGFEGEKAVDGSFTLESRWISAENDPQPSIEIDLGGVADLASVHVYSGVEVLVDFTVEVRTEDGWQQAAGNGDYVASAAGLGISGDRVRLSITKPSAGDNFARIFEIQVYESG